MQLCNYFNIDILGELTEAHHIFGILCSIT